MLQQGGGLGALTDRIDGTLLALDQEAVEAILLKGSRVGLAEEALIVGLVVGEQPATRTVQQQLIGIQIAKGRGDQPLPLQSHRLAGGIGIAPSPGVAQPQGGQQAQRRGLRPAVDRSDADQEVGGRGLGVVDEHIEVAALVEQASIHQLVFRLIAVTATVFLHQLLVGKAGLRIFVQPPHEAVGGGVGDVEVVILQVFAVVTLGIAQAEGPLLENRILAVPEGQGKTQAALLIAEAEQTVFSPAIDARSSMVVGKGAPGIAVGGIVLAHGAPLAIGEVAAPQAPGRVTRVTLGHASGLGGDETGHRREAFRSSAIRRALAITVRPKPMAGQAGNTLASAIVRLATSWLRPCKSTTDVAGLSPMRQVPQL